MHFPKIRTYQKEQKTVMKLLFQNFCQSGALKRIIAENSTSFLSYLRSLYQAWLFVRESSKAMQVLYIGISYEIVEEFFFLDFKNVENVMSVA